MIANEQSFMVLIMCDDEVDMSCDFYSLEEAEKYIEKSTDFPEGYDEIYIVEKIAKYEPNMTPMRVKSK
jgi:hypothetical protein